MKRKVRITLALITLFASVSLFSADVYAATITVTGGPCRIRSEASTSSEPVSSVNNNTKLEVLGSTTASDGYTWYKVKVEGDQTGYIRADLVSDPNGSVSSDNSSSSQSSDSTASEPVPAAEVVDSEALTAVVSADTVTVRESASTKSNKKGSGKNGQEVNINGEATDSDGKVWYQVSFEADGKTTEGFIRSDFLQITSTKADLAPEEPVEEEAAPEETAPEPVVNNDYEVRYEANSEGVDEWFLYDHIRGTKQSVNNIYAVMEQSMNYTPDDGSETKTLKIVIIVMAVVMLLLVICVAILLFKLRDSYEDFSDIDEDYDDDYPEEDEYEEEEDDRDYRGSGKKEKGSKRFGFKKRKRDDYDDYDDEGYDDEGYDDEEEEEPAEYVKAPRRIRNSDISAARPAGDGAWSTKGLKDIDDDMEFEFLDLDE